MGPLHIVYEGAAHSLRGPCDRPVRTLVGFAGTCYTESMTETTIGTGTPLGEHLAAMSEVKKNDHSYLVFNKQKIKLVEKITIGRDSDNDVVVDDRLASRHHCIIQKIKDSYFLKDEESTNGTFVNGSRIPLDKYIRLNPGDKITVGASIIEMS